MNQSFDTQLEVIRRALTDVVMPALEGADGHVIEQLHLSLAAAGFMQARLPHARRFYRADLRAYGKLAEEIAGCLSAHGAGDTDAVLSLASAAQTLLDDPEADSEDYIGLTRHIRSTVAGLSENSAGQDYESALDGLILAFNADAQLQARAWCEPFGFELQPEDLPPPVWTKQGKA